MEFPDDILMHIKEYSKPMTRPDWRKGAAFNRRYDGPIINNTDLNSFKNNIEFGFYIISWGLTDYGYEPDDEIHRWMDIIPDGMAW